MDIGEVAGQQPCSERQGMSMGSLVLAGVQHLGMCVSGGVGSSVGGSKIRAEKERRCTMREVGPGQGWEGQGVVRRGSGQETGAGLGRWVFPRMWARGWCAEGKWARTAAGGEGMP